MKRDDDTGKRENSLSQYYENHLKKFARFDDSVVFKTKLRAAPLLSTLPLYCELMADEIIEMIILLYDFIQFLTRHQLDLFRQKGQKDASSILFPGSPHPILFILIFIV